MNVSQSGIDTIGI